MELMPLGDFGQSLIAFHGIVVACTPELHRTRLLSMGVIPDTLDGFECFRCLRWPMQTEPIDTMHSLVLQSYLLLLNVWSLS